MPKGSVGRTGGSHDGHVQKRPAAGILRAIWLAVSLGLLFWLFNANASNFEASARDNQAAGLLLGLSLIVASHIVAPLTGFAVFISMAKIYGLPNAVAILYTAYCISSAANFFIARALGKPIVENLIGKDNVDRTVAALNGRSLLYVSLSRILGYY